MVIEKEVLEQLLAGRDPATVFSQDGLIDELKKALSERVLNAELDRHLDTDQDFVLDGGRKKTVSEKGSSYGRKTNGAAAAKTCAANYQV